MPLNKKNVMQHNLTANKPKKKTYLIEKFNS